MRAPDEHTKTSTEPASGRTASESLEKPRASFATSHRSWRPRNGPVRGVLLVLMAFLMACAQPRTPGGTSRSAAAEPFAGTEANREGDRAGLAGSMATGAAAGEAGPAGTSARAVFAVSGEPLVDGVVVGDGVAIDNLTVFPVLAAEQPDFGPLTNLDVALANGTAEVREMGVEATATANRDGPAEQQRGWEEQVQQRVEPEPWPAQLANAPPQIQSSRSQPGGPQGSSPMRTVSHPGGGDRVDTLVVDNKGELPIYILAGTVVKGGRQDRQIGQDVIIPPKSVVPVDAFCVEHGRWTAERQGRATGGKFKTLSQLATSKVRAAAQYEGKQGKVWEQVAEVNQANRKSSSSGSLLATLDAPDLQQARDGVRRKILAHLDQASPAGGVVGLAYAVDGKVQGVRWFANHQILGLFRDALANTAAVDAITAQASGSPKQGPRVSPAEVRRFIDDTEREATEERAKQTAGDNENRYSESDGSFRSKTTFGKPGRAKKVISSDYLAK